MRRRTFLQSCGSGILPAALLACGGGGSPDAPAEPPGPPTPDPLALPLLEETQLRFLGRFSLPEPGWSWGLGLAGQGQFLAANAATRALRLYEIAPIGGTAALVAEGAALPSWGETDNGWIPGGNIRHDGRLFCGQFQMYDEADTPWLFQTIPDRFAGAWTPGQRPAPLNGLPLRGLVGSFGIIPPAYRSLFGGHDLFACNLAGKSIIGNSSWGPSFLSFPSAAALAGGEVPARLLMAYDSGGLEGEVLTPGKLLPEVSTIAGAGIVPGTRTLIVFGMEPGSTCYGVGSACADRCSEDQGYHGYPYRAVVYAFDLRDLVRVRDGALAPGAVRPYGTRPGGVRGSPIGWRLDGVSDCWSTYNKSGFFDPDTRRIYMTSREHDAPVWVWQVG